MGGNIYVKIHQLHKRKSLRKSDGIIFESENSGVKRARGFLYIRRRQGHYCRSIGGFAACGDNADIQQHRDSEDNGSDNEFICLTKKGRSGRFYIRAALSLFYILGFQTIHNESRGFYEYERKQSM